MYRMALAFVCALTPASAWAQVPYPPPMPPIPAADMPWVQPAPQPDAPPPPETQAQKQHDALVKFVRTAVCGNQVYNLLDLVQSSPFSTGQKCYYIPSLPVSQWMSSTEVLVNNPAGTSISMVLEASYPLDGQMTVGGIYEGVDPVQYQSVGAGTVTAFHLQELSN